MTCHGSQKRFPIRAQWLAILGAALAAACVGPGDFSRAPTEISAPTGQTPTGVTPGGPTRGGPYSLSGILTVRTTSGTAPVANSGVGGYVIKTDGSSYGMAPVSTDANGRYEFSDVPGGVVILYAGAPHAYQPCADIATVSGPNAVKDIELLDSALPKPATTEDSPTLSGVVYRKTRAGKQPVAGAVIEYEYAPVIVTTATTDAQGRYSLCRLPLGRGGMEVWLNELRLGGVVVNIVGDDVVDLNF